MLLTNFCLKINSQWVIFGTFFSTFKLWKSMLTSFQYKSGQKQTFEHWLIVRIYFWALWTCSSYNFLGNILLENRTYKLKLFTAYFLHDVYGNNKHFINNLVFYSFSTTLRIPFNLKNIFFCFFLHPVQLSLYEMLWSVITNNYKKSFALKPLIKAPNSHCVQFVQH